MAPPRRNAKRKAEDIDIDDNDDDVHLPRHRDVSSSLSPIPERLSIKHKRSKSALPSKAPYKDRGKHLPPLNDHRCIPCTGTNRRCRGRTVCIPCAKRNIDCVWDQDAPTEAQSEEAVTEIVEATATTQAVTWPLAPLPAPAYADPSKPSQTASILKARQAQLAHAPIPLQPVVFTTVATPKAQLPRLPTLAPTISFPSLTEFNTNIESTHRLSIKDVRPSQYSSAPSLELVSSWLDHMSETTAGSPRKSNLGSPPKPVYEHLAPSPTSSPHVRFEPQSTQSPALPAVPVSRSYTINRPLHSSQLDKIANAFEEPSPAPQIRRSMSPVRLDSRIAHNPYVLQRSASAGPPINRVSGHQYPNIPQQYATPDFSHNANSLEILVPLSEAAQMPKIVLAPTANAFPMPLRTSESSHIPALQAPSSDLIIVNQPSHPLTERNLSLVDPIVVPDSGMIAEHEHQRTPCVSFHGDTTLPPLFNGTPCRPPSSIASSLTSLVEDSDSAHSSSSSDSESSEDEPLSRRYSPARTTPESEDSCQPSEYKGTFSRPRGLRKTCSQSAILHDHQSDAVQNINQPAHSAYGLAKSPNNDAVTETDAQLPLSGEHISVHGRFSLLNISSRSGITGQPLLIDIQVLDPPQSAQITHFRVFFSDAITNLPAVAETHVLAISAMHSSDAEVMAKRVHVLTVVPPSPMKPSSRLDGRDEEAANSVIRLSITACDELGHQVDFASCGQFSYERGHVKHIHPILQSNQQAATSGIRHSRSLPMIMTRNQMRMLQGSESPQG